MMVKCEFDILANTMAIDESSEPASLKRISIPFHILLYFSLFLAAAWLAGMT